MNALQKIIAGLAVAGTIASTTPTQAQQQASLTPTHAQTETSFRSTDQVTGTPLQRLVVNNDTWTFKYDRNAQMDAANKPNDIALLYLGKIATVKDINLGASAIIYGNHDGKDETFIDAYLTKHIGKASITLDIEKSFRPTGPSREYVALIAKHPRVNIAAGVWAQASFLKKQHDPLLAYGYVSVKNDHGYAAIGNKEHTGYAAAGIHGFENFGEFIFALNNRDLGTTWIKSQTAFGEASKGFYSNETFDVASAYFGMPAFFPIHFSPLSTKGSVALKLDYKHDNNAGTTETEAMLATNKTPIQLGLGINTLSLDGKIDSDVAIELYKDFKINDKLTGAAELRYNNRTKDVASYLTIGYAF